MFELASLKLSPSATLPLVHPSTREPLFADDKKQKPVVANLYGKASETYQSALHTLMNKKLAKKTTKDTAQNLNAEGIDFLVACLKSIDNLALNGKAVDNPVVVRELLSDPGYGWVKAQIDEFLAEDANFLQS